MFSANQLDTDSMISSFLNHNLILRFSINCGDFLAMLFCKPLFLRAPKWYDVLYKVFSSLRSLYRVFTGGKPAASRSTPARRSRRSHRSCTCVDSCANRRRICRRTSWAGRGRAAPASPSAPPPGQ